MKYSTTALAFVLAVASSCGSDEATAPTTIQTSTPAPKPAASAGATPSPAAATPASNALPASATPAASGGGAAITPPAAATPPAIAAAAGAANGAPSPTPGATSTPPGTPSAGPSTPAKADPPGTVTLTTDTFTLKAGQEIYKCQNFDNPFGGKDAAIQFLSTDMSAGSHHLHVYHMTTSASRTLEDCAISDFHPLLYSSGSPHNESTYPAGMAAKLLGTAGVRIQLHYLNSSDKDLQVQATLKLGPVEYASVTKWISELYFNQLAVRVAPGAGQTITTTCTIPKTYGTIGLISGGTHMHKRGVRFTAQTSTGAMLADVNTWDEPPPIKYDPPVMLNPGDKITWTCTYDNNTGRTLTFGESAENNEMCIYLARFFSAPDGAQLECQANGANGMTSTRVY